MQNINRIFDGSARKFCSYVYELLQPSLDGVVARDGRDARFYAKVATNDILPGYSEQLAGKLIRLKIDLQVKTGWRQWTPAARITAGNDFFHGCPQKVSEIRAKFEDWAAEEIIKNPDAPHMAVDGHAKAHGLTLQAYQGFAINGRMVGRNGLAGQLKSDLEMMNQLHEGFLGGPYAAYNLFLNRTPPAKNTL